MNSPILLSALALLVGFITSKIYKRILNNIATKKGLSEKRTYYIHKVFHFLNSIMIAMVLFFIWSVDIKGLSVLASSVFAVLGVALFAQWSILSNITASVIIFFTFPAKIGDRIRILDKDDTVEGVIKEITLFQVELSDDENNRVFYPNNLLLQKAVKKLV